MIPKECKRLAEVDFPIAEVSRHAVKEKSIKHGHPSTLHLWWARRPLASCRAMLMALLLPDPCDPLCPGDFKAIARKLLPKVSGSVGNTDYDLQRKLFQFIADFANWDNAHQPKFLEVSRALVKAAYPEETPLVVDPFAGGGSIPLEALRIGCDAFASDLNPVACLILKVMLEDIPRSNSHLVEELRSAGDEILAKARTELLEYYPNESNGSQPVVYLWARTVRCEAPNCGAEIPLIRSFWLCKKPNKKLALHYLKTTTRDGTPLVDFDIFEPKNENDVAGPTVSRAKATCLCCGAVLQPERVRSQLMTQNGGADTIFDTKGARVGGALLLAVVTSKNGVVGRSYRLPTESDYSVVKKAQDKVQVVMDDWNNRGKDGSCPFPDEPTPVGGGSGAGRAFSVQKYGIFRYRSMFNCRQLVTLQSIVDLHKSLNPKIAELIAFSITKAAMQNNSLCRWKPTGESLMDSFGRQAMPIVWDFAEANVLASSTGDFRKALDQIIAFIERSKYSVGQVQQLDACESPLATESVGVLFTDPPYYDAIPYSDLSDFFFVWLKRLLPNHPMLKDPYNSMNNLSPKDREIVQDETRSYQGRIKNKEFFESQMGKAFVEGRRILKEDGICSVVFAHKTTEGWEALLSGLLNAGFTITASWPIKTEMENKVGGSQGGVKKAMLLSSVHLVCRPRPVDANVGEWSEVIKELPNKVGVWIDKLEAEGIRGADLVFSCIGPALEIFSRYSKVEEADGKEVSIARYLGKVWEVVGRIALEQILGTEESKARNGAAGALEEDARLTALFLWTLQSTGIPLENIDSNCDEDDDGDEESTKKVKVKGGYSLVYDVARRFAQPLGIDLNKWNHRIIEIEKGTVRLLPISEREVLLFGTNTISQVDSTFNVSEQLTLFPEYDVKPMPKIRGKKVSLSGAETDHKPTMVTTLDRVHAAMLLQANGQTNSLRALLKSEIENGQDFIRLSNSLSALYPIGSEEKRLLDAMLLGIKSI